MPSFFGNQSKLLPWMPNPKANTNKFGLTMPVQSRVNIPPPGPTNPGVDPFNFLKKYEELNANRPNRLAYQQAIEQGAPEIERSKWARLGAMLAAGGSALGGTRAPEAANFGISAYFQPQMRSDEKYKERVHGLGQLANMEESDLANKMKALEAERSEFWKGREDTRAERQEGRADTKLGYEGQTTAAQIRASDANVRQSDAQVAHINKQIEDSNWVLQVNKNDGFSYLINKNDPSIQRKLTQTELTPEQEVKKIISEEEGREKARLPWRETEALKDIEIANIGADASMDRTQANIDARKQLAVSRLREAAGKLKPGDVAGNIYLSIANGIANDSLPEDAHSYLREKNGVLVADKGFTGSQATEDAINQVINSTISGGINVSGPNPPKIETSGPNAGRIKMLDPEGGEFYALPSEIEHLKTKGAHLPEDVPQSPNAPFSASSPSNRPTTQRSRPFSEMMASRNKGTTAIAPPVEPITPPINTPPPNIAPPVVPPVPPANIPPQSINPQALAPNMGVNVNPNGPQRGPDFSRFGVNIPAPTNPATLSPGLPQQQGFIPPGMPRGRTELNPRTPDFSRFGGGPNMAPTPPPVSIPPEAFNSNRPPIVPQQAAPNIQRQPSAPLNVNPIALNPPKASNNPMPLSVAAANRDIQPYEQFNDKLNSIKAKVKEETGLDIKVISGKRSAEEQARLYAKGRTAGAKGKTVTNADGKEKLSKHQTGSAADLRFVDKNGKAIEGDSRLQAILGRIAKEHGLTWGGDWKDPYDPLHIELK